MPATGSTLLYLEKLHELVVAQADDLQLAIARIMDPSPVGSPTDEDFKQILQSVRNEDRRALWSRAQLACLHMAVNVGDHVRALALLLSQPATGVPIYAHSTVARVAIESAAGAAHILDRNAPFEARFARGVALLINDSGMAQRTADRVPASPYMAAPSAEARRRHDELLGLISRAKIQLVPGKANNRPKGVRVSPDAPEEPADRKAVDLVAARFGDMPAAYGILSGVVHGMAHMLGANARFADRSGEWDTDYLDVGASALIAVSAAHAVFDAHAWHRGRQDDPALATMRGRMGAVDESMVQFARQHIQLGKPTLVTSFLSSRSV